MGVTVNASHVVSTASSSSEGGLLTLFCSSMGSFPWEIVLHELLQHDSFQQAAVLHKVIQCRSFPQGAVLQEQTAPVWVPHMVTSPVSKPAPLRASLSICLQILPGACSSAGSPQAAGRYLLHRGPPWAAGGQPASPWAAGESLLGTWSTSSPSFFTDLRVCRVVCLTDYHSSLPAAVAQQFPPPHTLSF